MFAEKDMKIKEKWVWFAEKCGVASSEMSEVYHKFESIDELYLASYERYIELGVSERLSERMSDKSLDVANKTVSLCSQLGADIIAYSDDEYPASLRSLKDPPAVLYCLGKLPDLNKKLCVSVVGTRNMSEYGMRTAYKIAYEVASSGAIIVSGMALGIDSVAHCASIEASGETVAVLGCGIDVIYPKAHTKLRNAIIKHGAVITEYPPSTEPRGFHFPVRNRIISGLAQGTLVIDASVDSGSMITAKNAILQGRDVFAVPSNIGSENSSGSNLLIRDGAHTVLSGKDIINHYFYIFRNVLSMDRLKESERLSDFKEGVLESLGVNTGARKSAQGMAITKEKAKKERTEKKPDTSEVPKVKKSEADGVENKASVKNTVEKTDRGGGDESLAAFVSLTEKHRKIFEEMPLDKAISIDYLINAGFNFGDVIGALTILEIKGLVSSLPGALYIRK